METIENNEQKQAEQKKAEEQSAEDIRARSLGEIDARIDRANSAAKRLEEANKKAEELATINAEIVARNVLGGRTEAGQQPLAKPEISPKDYAKSLLNGKL